MKIKELREKNNEELNVEKDKLMKEARDLRFKKITSVVENPLKIKNIRRDIARINTLLHLRELEVLKKELNK
ncbi:MAG TPA: 50S ribosomal protein L29 [Spirochaetota bacterium]|nr:50S ribosomal protein L29 [Spirochaetota bacterium]